MEYPDKWILLEAIDDEGISFQKVFATWSGSYLTGYSWKLNSGVKERLDNGDHWDFVSESGNIYRCHKDMYGIAGGYNHGVLDSFLKKFPDRLKVLDKPD